MLDFLIKGARIIDGNLTDSYIGDIGIEKDRIITKDLDNSNAKEIIEWSYRNKIKNISIITSDYHMPRSMLVLFKKGKGLNFYASPVTSNIHLKKNLFRDFKLLQFLLEEYFKYLLYLVI